jgi:hypothetical protein
MDREVLLHQMTERFQELYGQALEAVEKAPDGQWIAASEWAFRDTFQKLMQESYEAALQARIDAHATATAAAFSPSGQRGGRRNDVQE